MTSAKKKMGNPFSTTQKAFLQALLNNFINKAKESGVEMEAVETAVRIRVLLNKMK